MAETMEQYMSKTRADYGSGVARPKIEDKDNFELKGQFLKELRTNTFSSSDHEDANGHIEKVLEIFDQFHILNITIGQVILRALLMSLTGAASRWMRNEPTDFPLKEEGKTLKEAYYTQFGGPFQGGGYKAAALGFYQRNNANPSYQERRQSMEDTLIKFMSESAKRHEDNSNLIKEIRALTDAAIRNQGASIKNLEIQIEQMSKVLQERGFGSLPSSTEANPRDQVKLISTTIEADSYPIRRASVSVIPLSTYLNLGLGELAHTKLTVKLADRTVKYPKGIAENVLAVPLILKRPFLSTACAKIDVYKRKITLRNGEEIISFKSVKPTSSLIKRVYMPSLRERIELDLEARLMGETLVINRSLDPLSGDYIELNNLNEPFELRRNQGDDLMPTIKEGEVTEEFKTRDDELDIGIDDYPSYCNYDKKIHIDYAHNLKFSCMIGFKFTHANFLPLLYVNVMSKKFHNSIIKGKMMYKENNDIGALMNVPIFVRTFYVVTDFTVLENMDAYRDEGMSDVIFGEPLLREVGIKARRFKGMITIYNGNKSVTYQMTGFLHPYQKLKGFYKGNLELRTTILEMPNKRKNGSLAGTLACMRWNGKEKLKKSLT
ncbi:hypothetical protein Tco_0750516 [Tanacetum coccineum]|uniref:Uncharacterized protein n=1 Tax=Tanacetum coccineum TaxID=301880 RepID=A0ABQ4Z2F0_9ASTR